MSKAAQHTRPRNVVLLLLVVTALLTLFLGKPHEASSPSATLTVTGSPTVTPTPTPSPSPSSQPGLSLSSSSLSFTDQVVSTTSAQQIEALMFQASSAIDPGITFTSIALSGANAGDFVIQSDSCSGKTFSFGNCQIAIAFRPQALGPRSATVIINDNLGGIAPTFSLAGRGVPLVLTSLAISPPSDTVVSGSQLQFHALGSYNDGTQNDVTSQAHWTSSKRPVATVDAGLVSGIRAGNSVITAAIGDIVGRASLGVDYQVIFRVQPSTTIVNREISPAVKVQIRDNGHPVEDLRIKLTLAPDAPNPAKLSGVRSDERADGLFVFEELKLDYQGNGYRLVASLPRPGGGESTVTSAPFNETPIGDPCLGPNPACSSGCQDSDGDGLNDAWEIARAVDLNGDGKISPKYDLPLPDADPFKQDVYVQYDWMDWGLPGNACNTDSDCAAISSGHTGETCTGPQVVSTSAGSCRYACTADADCAAPRRGQSTERCVANSCVHTHDPEILAPGALQAVVDSFAAHGINLHIIRGHVIPHSLVTSFRQDGSISSTCEGAEVSQDVGIGKYAVSLYDVKAFSSPDRFKIAYHYALFGHYSSCDSRVHCGACPVATNPDGSPKNLPNFGQSGIAEISGNDFIVSLGGLFSDLRREPGTFNVGSTFMHELGHNLGLRHGGGVDTPCQTAGEVCPGGGVCATTALGNLCLQGEDINAKPNYLSVMNYRYQFSGIQSGSAVGSILPTSQRLDYSTQTLPTGGNTPGYLDQSNVLNLPSDTDPGLGLSEPAGLGSGVADIITFTNATESGIPKIAPSEGPVDWDGDGLFISTNVQADTNCGPAGFADHQCIQVIYPKLKGHTDWGPAGQNIFTYNFQCTPYGGPMGDGASSLAQFAENEMSAEMAMQAHVALPIRSVAIDITPECSEKIISPGSPGEFSVALLGSDDLDVSEVEQSSLHFHGATPLRLETRDLNGDGKPDLLVFFDQRSVRLNALATKAHLTGWLKSSQAFIGEDQVSVMK